MDFLGKQNNGKQKAILRFRDLFGDGEFTWPLQNGRRNRDLQLEDQKGDC